MSPDCDCTCAGVGTGSLDVSYSALERRSVYSSICHVTDFSSKLDFLSFKESSKVDWLGNSHLQTEILWVWCASRVSMENIYMNKWTYLILSCFNVNSFLWSLATLIITDPVISVHGTMCFIGFRPTEDLMAIMLLVSAIVFERFLTHLDWLRKGAL